MEAAEDDDHNISSKWAQFSKAYNVADNVLGRKGKSSKPRIRPESWAKVEEQKQLKSKQKMLSPKGSKTNYMQNTGVKTRR